MGGMGGWVRQVDGRGRWVGLVGVAGGRDRRKGQSL